MSLQYLQIMMILCTISVAVGSIVEVYSSQHHQNQFIQIKHDRKTNAVWLTPAAKNDIKLGIKRAKSMQNEYSKWKFPSINVKIEEKFHIENIYEIQGSYYVVREYEDVPENHWNKNCIFLLSTGKNLPKTNCLVCFQQSQKDLKSTLQTCIKNGSYFVEQKKSSSDENLGYQIGKGIFGLILMVMTLILKEYIEKQKQKQFII